MNKLKAIILSIAMLTGLTTSAQASGVDSIIKKSDLNKTATIAVSIKDVKSGRAVYEYNEHKLLNPASTQKVFTMRSAYKELGADYTFKTTFYIDKKNNLYIKLGADPTITTLTLKTMFKDIKDKINGPVNDIVIDPAVIDNQQWGIGWMWDDDANTYLPKYSPFSVNENKINLAIEPGKEGRFPEIKNKSPYSMAIINMAKNGNENKLNFDRKPWLTGDMTYVTGTVKSAFNVKLPVDSPERNFNEEILAALAKAKIKSLGTIKVAPTPNGLTQIGEITSRPLVEIVGDTLKNSNNFNSEMIFKKAGGSSAKSQGTTAKAVDMFNSYYSDIKSDKPLIVDGCGISRNDLMSADWMTEALNKLYKDKDFDEYVVLLPKPMEGTLSDRLLDISLKLRAKTGTASGISSFTGYIDTKTGKKYSFAIIIQNYTQSTLEIKKFEDELIREIYKM